MQSETVDVVATGFAAADADTSNNRATVRIMSDTDSDIGNDSDALLNVANHTGIELAVGANVITVMVTAADYSAMNTYTVYDNPRGRRERRGRCPRCT